MSDIRQRRRRSRRNIKRIRQRNRRVLLSVVLLCFIVWAGFVNVSKQKKEQEAEQAYAEQQEKKAREAKEVKAGKEEKDEPVLAAESEKNKWYLKLVNAKNPMIQTDVPEVETETLDMVKEAVEAGADIIMLDNMTPETMKKAVELIDGRAETECSGNVTKENIDRLISIGVDYISSGALTHSSPILDLSLKNLREI